MASTGKAKSKKGSKDPDRTGVDRYKHDMEQVRLMTGGAKKASEDDVMLGLRGLDEASRLKEEGKEEKALKMYQSSIAVLIRYLRGSPFSPGHSIDPAVLEERIKAALSEAEELKDSVDARAKQEETENAKASLSSTLLSAVSWSPQKDAKEPNTSALSPQSASSAPSRASPAPKQPARDMPKTPSKRRATLDYNNDPMVRTVKTDLYVDPSDLENTTWEDICGLENAKQSLQEAAIFPLLRPDLYTGLRRQQNVLLYGPPGTGKTMLVRAVAKESSCLLFACTASALTSKWHGEGEKLVRTLFRLAHDVAPSIIFMDEMDSLLSTRSNEEHEASRRFKTEFMIQVDGIARGNGGDVENGVLVLGCTNCPWNVDDAVLRRFPRRIYVPLPDAEARRGLLNKLLKKAGKHNLTARHVSKLVSMTDGYSCSDISSIASEAAFGPLRSIGGLNAVRNVKSRDVRAITIQDFEDATSHTLKSVSPSLLEKYKQWEQQQSG